MTIELRAMGLHAISCDLEPCSGGHPEWHHQADVLPLLQEDWDLVIAFPPCTHLANSGNRWKTAKKADGRFQAAVDFFMAFTRLPCLWAIENPVGEMSTLYRKPDQIIQPWQFGHPVSKTTCLWMSGLPDLVPTNIVDDHGEVVTFASRKRMQKWYNNKRGDAAARSKTFTGIARAMARQWGNILL